jgi:hypothetical protein
MAFKDMGKEYLAYKRSKVFRRIVGHVVCWTWKLVAVYIVIDILFIRR